MSNYAKITNFASKDALPSGNSNKIVKGTEIDDEFNALASAIASKSDTNSPTFTGTPSAPTALAGTSTNQIATTSFIATALANLLPTGVITLWSGATTSVPFGWYLCDGTNGTPDLRNRFVVGAGSTYTVGSTGGSADAVVVSHSHTATSSSSVSDPGHQHGMVISGSLGAGGANVQGPATGGAYNTLTAYTGISVSTSTSIASSGVSGTNANLPPYYALAYIMKA